MIRRILALLPGVALGGAEAHTATLLRALAARGVDIAAAIAPDLAAGFAAMLGPALGHRVRPAAIGWDGSGRAAARQAQAAIPLIAATRPQLALLPLPWPTHALGLQAALAGAGVPALAIAHLAPHWPEPAATPAGSTLWAAVSRPVAARLAATFGLPLAAVATVANGVVVPGDDPRLRAAARVRQRSKLGLDAEARLVLAVGRLEPNKGADLLPALAATLHAATGATLVALGDGDLRAALAAHPAAQGAAQGAVQGAAHGVAPALRLAGQVADVGAWMLAADALVLPSRLEGCPLVFLEAAAYRLPVVATAAAIEAWGDAAPDLARVFGEPAIAALAEGLAEALARGAATRARVAAAHATAAAHDRAAMLEAWLGLLRVAA